MPISPISPAAPTAPLAATGSVSRGGSSFAAALEAAATGRAPGSGQVGDRIATAATRGLEAVERAQSRLDALLAAARSGRTFTAAELIALQSQAYRYSNAVELGSKLVEQGAQAVKQALQAQV